MRNNFQQFLNNNKIKFQYNFFITLIINFINIKNDGNII